MIHQTCVTCRWAKRHDRHSVSKKMEREYMKEEGTRDDKRNMVLYVAAERAQQVRYPLRCSRMDSATDGLEPRIPATLAHAHEDGTADEAVVYVALTFGCVKIGRASCRERV